MGKVFTGKVMIPGDRINEYLEALEEAEKAREPSRQHAEALAKDFEDYLSGKLSLRTVRKHSRIIYMFIEFLFHHTDVEKLEEVTKGMVNTHFRNWYKKKVWGSSNPIDLKVALKKFFLFLASEKGITNEKVLKSLS